MFSYEKIVFAKSSKQLIKSKYLIRQKNIFEYDKHFCNIRTDISQKLD